MNSQNITYANEFGEILAPFLSLLRSTYFFEAYVFMPLMTIASIFVFRSLKKKSIVNRTFSHSFRSRYRIIFLSAYYSLCFIATNSTAVALKTLIVEEMDYEEPVWFLHLVSYLHFYISSVVIAFIWLIRRNKSLLLDKILIVYVQVGMLGGYYTAFYRLENEPFEILDVTTGMSGVFFLLWFAVLNTDLVLRFRNKKEDAHNLSFES